MGEAALPELMQERLSEDISLDDWQPRRGSRRFTSHACSRRASAFRRVST
jgi:hypothetical protein